MHISCILDQVKLTGDQLVFRRGMVPGGAVRAGENFPHDLATNAAGIVGEFNFIFDEFGNSFGAEGVALETSFDCYPMGFSAWWNRFLTDFAFVHCSFF